MSKCKSLIFDLFRAFPAFSRLIAPFLGNGRDGDGGHEGREAVHFGVSFGQDTDGGQAVLLKLVGQVGEPPAAHHIVALRARGAGRARALLLAAGTGIKDLNDIRNGVALPRNLKIKVPGFAKGVAHSVIHTKKYYQELATRLRLASPGRRVAVLRTTARELQLGKFPY